MLLQGTLGVLKEQYPDAEILTAQTAQSAKELIKSSQPALVITDLSMPEMPGDLAQIETGMQLLRSLMQLYPTLNIVVQSSYPRSLVRLKPSISLHEGGFTVVNKSLPVNEMLTKVDWSLKGLIYTPKEMRSGLELSPEWLEVLKLAFQEGLQDKVIAEHMNVSERTVRNYWTQLQNVLGVYPDAGKNIRIQTEIRAREEGLID
ncbi:response regulator receiver protein [Scytonema hofmannii PCC 7110]|uniref:Response regulator receiver protein n=2 Tax=Scytonema hofmannii TaxID=34078 RepID=A0A139WQC5_9CYAN|nr:response regulator receiver protein [Scytonema hofmannii PCC 7110]